MQNIIFKTQPRGFAKEEVIAYINSLDKELEQLREQTRTDLLGAEQKLSAAWEDVAARDARISDLERQLGDIERQLYDSSGAEQRLLSAWDDLANRDARIAELEQQLNEERAQGDFLTDSINKLGVQMEQSKQQEKDNAVWIEIREKEIEQLKATNLELNEKVKKTDNRGLELQQAKAINDELREKLMAAERKDQETRAQLAELKEQAGQSHEAAQLKALNLELIEKLKRTADKDVEIDELRAQNRKLAEEAGRAPSSPQLEEKARLADEYERQLAAARRENAALADKLGKVDGASKQIGDAIIEARNIADGIVDAANERARVIVSNARLEASRLAEQLGGFQADIDALRASLNVNTESMNHRVEAMFAAVESAQHSFREQCGDAVSEDCGQCACDCAGQTGDAPQAAPEKEAELPTQYEQY